MIQTLRVRNPNALRLPDLDAFLRRAFRVNTLVDDLDAALAEIGRLCTFDDVGLFLAQEDGVWHTVALCEQIESALNPGLAVAHFYNSGRARHRDAVVKMCVDFARAGGQTRILGTDMHRKPRAFQKVFRGAGTAHLVGQMYAFDLQTKDGDDGKPAQGRESEGAGHDAPGVQGAAAGDLPADCESVSGPGRPVRGEPSCPDDLI